MDQLRFAAESGYHAVQFYSDDEFLCDVIVDFLFEAVEASRPALVIATADHRRAIVAELAGRGIDVDASIRARTFRLLDAEETLALFMVNGMPDARRFKAAIGGVLAELAGAPRPRMIRAYGEMVDVLGRSGNPEAAIRLEVLWNELAMTHTFALLCSYSAAHVDSPLGIQNVCNQHTHVLPTRSTSLVA